MDKRYEIIIFWSPEDNAFVAELMLVRSGVWMAGHGGTAGQSKSP